MILLIGTVFGMGGVSLDKEEHQTIQVNNYVCVNIYKEGTKHTLLKNDSDKVANALGGILKAAREMPAFGVALHDETLEAMQSGLWIEFEFGGINIHKGMCFEKLLLKLEKNIYGFNLMRFYDGKYDGRCFYFDIEDCKIMNCLYELIISILGN